MTRLIPLRLHHSGAGQSTGFVLLSGVAWGIVVTTFETLAQPPLELSPAEFLVLYSRIVLHFSASGIVLAWLTSRISSLDRRFPAFIAVVAAVGAAMATALLIDWLSVTFVPAWHNDPMTVMWEASAVAAHMGWTFAVYGGLYVLTFLFLRNEAQSRERLRLAELARIEAEARIDRAVSDTSPRISPDLLLRALSELAGRYDENHSRADALLDRLVQLLRSASGDTPRSRVGRDAELARSLELLRAELDPQISRQEVDHEHIGNR